MTSLGQVVILSIEGEEQLRKDLFTSYDTNESEQYPVTSCSIYSINHTNETIDIIVTTLGHGLYHCSLDIQNDQFTTVKLASPSLPITCYSVIQSNHSYHLTTTALQEKDLPATQTLLMVLSDSTFIAYDLTLNTRNFEYSILSWLMPLDRIRDMNVMNSIIYNSINDVFMVANKDFITIFKRKQEVEEVEFSAEMRRRLLQHPFNHLERLLQ